MKGFRSYKVLLIIFGLSSSMLLTQNCSNVNSQYATSPTESAINQPVDSITETPVSPVQPGTEPFGDLGPFTAKSKLDVFIADVPTIDSFKSLKMNIWYPEGVSALLPVIVHIHGGGWKSGEYNQCFNYSKNSTNTNLCKHMASRGYAVVSITYRLSHEAKFPSQLHDVKAAIRFLRKNHNTIGGADFKLDPDRIGVFGSSAGGHLASLLGTTSNQLEGDLFLEHSSHVSSVVAFYGPTDFTLMDTQLAETFPNFGSHNPATSGESLLINCLTNLQSCGNLAQAANPLTYIDGSEPPFLLRHGKADNIVPYQQSKIFHEALSRVGVPSDYFEMDGVGHNFNSIISTNQVAADAYDDAVSFFDRTLKGRSQ